MRFSGASLAGAALLSASGIQAIKLDPTNLASVKAASKIIAENIMAIYASEQASDPDYGLFGTDYYFGEGALAWNSMVHYSHLTGDTTYDDTIAQAIAWQFGENLDFHPANQTIEDNPGQSLWALAALEAAEINFQPPPAGSGASTWLEPVVNAFNEQVGRWDTSTCGGGLHYEMLANVTGYQYKNGLVNGAFFNLAARLYALTGNETYASWAMTASKWAISSGLQTPTGKVLYGVNLPACNLTTTLITDVAGLYLQGYNYLGNITESPRFNTWPARIFRAANEAFATVPNSPKDGLLTEISCTTADPCEGPELAFRGILARGMAGLRYSTRNSDGSLHQEILKTIQVSSVGAAGQCVGGANGTSCGADWASTTWDGTTGLGQELAALDIILANYRYAWETSTSKC